MFSFYLKDISSDGQVENVSLGIDDDVLGDVLLRLRLSCLDFTHCEQLDVQLDVQTCGHLDDKVELSNY